MHEHAHPLPPVCHLLFQAANIAIALGYASVPVLVLRYLNLTPAALIFGIGFFVGCAGTHLWMAFGSGHHVTFWWVVWHVVQAICTWGFIVTFGRDLRRARRRLERSPEVLTILGDAGGA